MAGSGGFTVEKQAMANGAAAISEAASQIAGHLGRLNSDVETMLGGWQNQSSKAMQDLHAAWDAEQTKLKQALETMRQILDQTSTAYETADQEQSDSLSQLKNSFNA